MQPRVILFNAVSLDGRIDWFNPDPAQFYGLVSTWKEDCTLAGSDTILAASGDFPTEDADAFDPAPPTPRDTRPILAITDSRGRVRSWHALRQAGYWRDFVALCTDATPQEYLDYLKARHVSVIIAGRDKVDLRAAFAELADRYGVTTVRVDSGGTLNGAILRAGLGDEVSVLVYPRLVGGESPTSIFRAPDLTSADGVLSLELTHMEQIDGGAVWLRYQIKR